jgi:hypothetical protein
MPQPDLGFPVLGLEGDSSVAVGMRGLVSPSGYKSYEYLLWTGRRVHLIGGTGGLWVDERDVDGDGIAELVAHVKDRANDKSVDTLVEHVYSFDVKTGRYHRISGSSAQER